RSDAFKFQLEQYKLATARMQECVNVMSDIEREMNRPVGTRHSYEMLSRPQVSRQRLRIPDTGNSSLKTMANSLEIFFKFLFVQFCFNTFFPS
ncbi:hypothetical protein L9F63_024790, partial [Diploptera punctata]